MKPDIIIAIASAFVALLALGVSIWQGMVTRRHNRLSVKPFLSVNCSMSNSDEIVGINVKNTGVGPLLMKCVSLHKGDLKASLSDGTFKKMLPALASTSFRFTVMSAGYSILPNETVWIISTRMHDSTNNLLDTLFDSLTGVTINFEFESIYSEKFQGGWSLS